MHSLELQHTYDSNKQEVRLTVLIKTLYSIKLQYPTGIEFDIPKTYRSIYRFNFSFGTGGCRLIFAEHWNWLIRAIHAKTPYTIRLDYGQIEYRDDAIIWSVNSMVPYGSTPQPVTTSSFYLPLEYCRDDMLRICQEISAIYQQYDNVIGSHYQQYHNMIMIGSESDELARQIARQIAQLEPTKFPVVIWGVYFLIYYNSHSDNHILDIPEYYRERLRRWLESTTIGQTFSLFTSHDSKYKWTRQADHLHIGMYDDVYEIERSSFDMPVTLIPRLCRLLGLTGADLTRMREQGNLLQNDD
jgi:hypothetical protein